MSRTEGEIRQDLADNSPSWFRKPGEVAEALLGGLSAMWALLEAALGTLHDRTFITDADGSWLDEHGRERTIPRRAGEPDSEYRERIRAFADLVTPKSIKAAVDRVLEIPECRLEEHLGNGSFADHFFADVGYAYEPGRSFTIYIPEQVKRITGSFASGATPDAPATESLRQFAAGDDLLVLRHMFAEADGPATGSVYAKVIEEVERTRAAGITYRVVVEAA